ncbi:M-phase inducer phosphatase cdc-25.2 [Dirofilaria immitis]
MLEITMNSNLQCNDKNISENNSNKNFAVVSDTLLKNLIAATELNINRNLMETESSIAKFEFKSVDCQQRSSVLDQTSEILNLRVVRNSLMDRTNISIPEVRHHSSKLRFLPFDCFSAENGPEYSECSQSISPLYLADGSNSFGDLIRTKQLHLKRSQKRPAFKKLNRLKNVLEMETLSSSSFGKLYNLFPITRFRAHLQGTSRNTLVSPSLPSTSTPNKLESRYKKRHIPEERINTGSAKKMKGDEPMEESFEGMDIDESTPNDQDNAIEDDDNLSINEPGNENISFSQACHRSHSSTFLGISEIKEPKSPPFFLEVQYELDIIKNPDVPSSAFACISAETLAALLMSMTMEQFLQRFILIDCRYPFEFLGGHIRGAYNLFDPAAVEAVFYPDDMEQRTQLMTKKPIFYCEFSQKRAPAIAYELRALDRKLNVGRYPMVDYPEMYLLQYGYRNFYLSFSEVPDLLQPKGYVKMSDAAHLDELKNYKFHRIRTVASVYHTLARDRYNRQPKEELDASTTENDPDMMTPPRRLLPMRLFLNSPESPSHFPTTPKSRPVEERGRDAPSRSVCRRLFGEDNLKRNDPGPGPSTRDF